MGSKGFEGLAGRATAKVMARMNRPAEIEAVEVLAPSAGDRVLAIGIGPGVGVNHLAGTVAGVRIVGIDPSAVMLAEARRRNRTWIEAGRVELVRTAAATLTDGDASFDGAIAVNSIQLWDPFEASLHEVSRVLRPGGRLVSLTHDWALRKSTGREPPEWFLWVSGIARRHGLIEARMWPARAEDGKSMAFEATKE
jgi:ubiquinone/menaquinone biosynthesis C-methylase UbiE